MIRFNRSSCKLNTNKFVSRPLQHQPRWLQLQELETKCVPATFIITDDDDNLGIDPPPGDGQGMLRQAIVDANASAGPDDIATTLAAS